MFGVSINEVGMKFRAGYLFKISHTEVHYLKNKKIDRRKKYANNFSTDKNEAFLFNDKAEFEGQIKSFLDAVNSEDRDDDYHFVMAFEEVEDLTKQQKEDIKVAMDKYFNDKKEIRGSGLSESELNTALLSLSKAFIDTHKDVALHYQCSGRGLPARDYHMRVNYGFILDSVKHLIVDEYLLRIEVNIKRYRANLEALETEETNE